MHSENTLGIDHFPSRHLTVRVRPMAGTENGAVSLESPTCLRWGFVASPVELCQHTVSLLPKRELKINADFFSCVYSTLPLGYPLSTGVSAVLQGAAKAGGAPAGGREHQEDFIA